MSEAVFLQGNLMRHIAVMSFTASVGILALFAVDFVDVMFISMLGQKELAAAVGYAGSLLFFTNAICIGLSIAAVSLVARTLGAGQPGKAKEYATSVALLTVGVSILIPSFAVPNLPFLLGVLGAEGETLEFAISYSQIIMPTMCFMGMAMTTMAILRAHGAARVSMNVTLLGGAVNAFLDPILIFWAGFGLEGAAYASVIARACMMVYGVWAVTSKYNGFAKPSLATFKSDFKPVWAIAAPAVMTNLATPVGNAIVTREMAQFGSEAVAAMAVIGRLTPLAFAVVLALSGAIGPIVGQNFGAKKYDRVRKSFINGLIFVAGYVAIVSVILYVLRQPIGYMFDATGEMAMLIYLFCGPLALLQFFNGAIFVCNASFNNLGYPLNSTYLNWGRHTLGTWPFVLIGASFMGSAGVLIGQAVGGVFFALVGMFVTWRLMGKLIPACEEDELCDEKRLHQVTGQRSW
ncbi:MATE family efflux transporter [Terasakiella sp. A23]|uniref:MATE family efflux transporter n=1 Tax=Terasakiella sp. FCG-A23 TaxID=3080561 RepID=UPI0029547689|nr:MATE family efflux transporter [Terasakiella sp. A23]MDV7340588.1 MATE family efflux transporter [Terasakiella sp. A23]